MIASAFTPLDYSEFILLGVGVLVLIVGAVRLACNPRAAALAPKPNPPRFTALDILVVFIASLIGCQLAIHAVAPPAPASQPASQPTTSPASQTFTPPQLALASVCAPVAGLLIAVPLARHRVTGGLRAWGLTASHLGLSIKTALLAYLAVWPLCAAALWVTKKLINIIDPALHLEPHSTLAALRHPDNPLWIPVCLVLGAAVLAPLYEEFFFRGMIQTTIARYTRSPWIAILASGLIFGLFHYTNIETVPPLVIFGFVVGYVYARTGSLTTTFLIHLLFNSKSLVWLFCGAET